MSNRRSQTLGVVTLVLAAWLADSADAKTVLLGTVDLKGGNARREVSTAAVSSGDVLHAVLRNQTALSIGDLTVEVRQVGSAGEPPAPGTGEVQTTGGTSGPQPGAKNASGSGWSVNFKQDVFPGEVAPGGTATVDITLGDPGTGVDLEVVFVPSAPPSCTANLGESNLTVAYALSTTTDLVRSRTECWRRLLLAPVTNDDDRSDLVRLDGTITRPAGSPPLVDVRLFDPDGGEIQGFQKSLTGDTFSLSSLLLPPHESVHVVLVFDQPYHGESIALMLEASFD